MLLTKYIKCCKINTTNDVFRRIVKMKKRRIISIILIFAILVTCFSGCKASNKKSIVGQWYNEKGKCLDIRSDGTWNLEDSYGTGTYKLLDDKETFEFTDFYGDTQESKINEDDLGQYIDFGYYGDFYKDAYPSKEEIEKVKAKNAISLNPFEGIKYEVSGISPYCKIAINNQGCSNEVRKYVTYILNKDYYANGETAVVTAVIAPNTGENSYMLSSNSAQYNVLGQDEYITHIEENDLNILKNEINDKINALISASIGSNQLCDVSDMNILDYETRLSDANFYMRNGITKVTPEYSTAYFSTLKKENSNRIYNCCSFIYCLNVEGDVNGTICKGKLFINLSAVNIVKNKNGLLTWNDEKCDFSIAASYEGIDNLVSNTVMSNSDVYNISQIEVK